MLVRARISPAQGGIARYLLDFGKRTYVRAESRLCNYDSTIAILTAKLAENRPRRRCTRVHERTASLDIYTSRRNSPRPMFILVAQKARRKETKRRERLTIRRGEDIRTSVERQFPLVLG